MRVFIGKYKNFFGPYQIAEKILFWKDKYEDNSVHEFGKFLSDVPGLHRFCEFVQSLKSRSVSVKLHDYDTWSAFSTMSYIILPMLKQLKDQKCGTPWTKHSDGPWYYRFTPHDEYHYDDEGSYNHERWEWIMDEMIWAFEQLVNDDWEDRYTLIPAEIDWSDHPEDDGETAIPLRWKVQGSYDMEGLKSHQNKINRGLILFGTYFQNLWT